MSTINNALSKLAEQQSAQNKSAQNEPATVTNTADALVRAKVAPVKSSRLVWAVGGFTLSLGLGAWAVSSAPNPIQTSVMTQNDTQFVQPAAVTSTPSMPSNTSKVVEPVHTTIYEAPKVAAAPAPKAAQSTVQTVAATKPAATRTVAAQPVTKKVNTPAPQRASVATKPSSDGVLLASNNTQPTATQDAGESSMQVHHVELTHRQMADKAIDRANKALESNDFAGASAEFQTALRYVPEDENTRRKLAALYYGNNQVRKSAELLEEGIKINKNSTALRMSLAGILLKEDQPEAALSSLGYIPDDVTDKYLAMRAALAQKLKNNEWALQSYQMLSQRDPENGRWWLGLGIQQERSAQLKEAKESYTKAINKVGLSSQSQAFIRDRINVLTSLEQGAD
ncbi:tetratricopeptide repeat protein [Vibrio litoralis]|uniref:tetratricopeptide repeat protein n=1 Tax=Vibrio litoralis TaxID=335972 RepID=UPI0003FB5642|nr:tetratricopeptide repeat protein [Vibrio litoralis]